ncbi:hypothetical protein MKW98_020214 [Papaver atlanticum]|uniref:X8 domain-containing protein n=1 Tax=Papaver atlanticum TaxID=357466 RepID=A0AAD4SB74_9MAGN|nr:hypothetical protein MKW98_020214 [Papaver atlanticum]
MLSKFLIFCCTCEDLATTYCVAKSFGADMDSMEDALSWTCGVVDFSPLQQGNRCFEPDTIEAHASYAFNLYYQQNNSNPSHGTCIFNNHNPGFTASTSRLQYGGILAVVQLVGVH